MRTLDDILVQLRAIKPELERRYPIRELAVFGSYARGEQTEDSDLDVLVLPGEGMTLIEFAGLQRELSESLGLAVDLVSKRALRPRIGERILAEATAI
ncbi:nucleotidyltransferase family protein [Magnetospirillum sp. UT-4]|uniref:nucleotidyltransferase family protein n=1 Tax=Magnetospirillum sp. UT-4 TaxID=2681467 RepID=UPI00137FCB11|nr:nucleotidyltransferase family protein [Magnetospirillum sp. UT-4]CAA7618703.1 conserved hypothetical protein [Magnetospirillum sp. UT-4]